ncbi:MAG TPA: efflux RND transporter periplasmic adaptor subunit [Verrucomicrobiae bacterium]|nr:efflux RND transporter periplasmic adaptor subunit [Verrucomicrobiae bacterium]
MKSTRERFRRKSFFHLPEVRRRDPRFTRILPGATCIISGLILAALAVSCSRKSAEKVSKSSQEPAPVLVAKAETRDVPVQIQGIGTVQAYSTVSIRSQITGAITDVHFEEGQEVKAGDLLFTLDQRPWLAALNQAKANFKRDEAQMINARLEFERTSNLFESRIASQQNLDAAQADYLAAQSTMAADSAEITNAEVNLSYTEIRAPIDGRTGSLNVKNGNVVKAPDDVLVTITQVHPIYVGFSVPERELHTVRQQLKKDTLTVKAYAPGETNRVSNGVLTFIDNAVDTNTGTILLKATFPNTNNWLWPGQFVQAELTLSVLKNAVVVPTQAVQTGQNGEYIFVVKPDSTVEMRPIVSGITVDDSQVIQSGLRSGETVVTDGQLRLTPGAEVTVKSSEANANSTEAE